MPRFLLLLCLVSSSVLAQTDSVTISGRILNLTPRLYRESPNVLISRNNLLQSRTELTRPAPLNPDGTYTVKMPVIFGQEEMYFSFASISTAFLAAPGAITIDLNADSLFRAAIPFSFGGVNARVNAQYARYKAFEAKQPKIDNEKLSQQVSNADLVTAFTQIRKAYYGPLEKFTRDVERPFPLVKEWVMGTSRYNAASFVYDMATYETRRIGQILDDSLRPKNDPILTAARAVSVERAANYVIQSENGQSESLPISDLAGLLLRYCRQLTDTDRDNLLKWKELKKARESDLRQIQRILGREGESMQRILRYQMLINRAKTLIDSASRQTVTAFWLANSLPTLTIDKARLLYSFARPQLTDARLVQSMDELYRLAVGDSVRIRQAVDQLNAKPVMNLDISPGIFVSKTDNLTGALLLSTWAKTNRSRLVYALLWSPEDENSLQSVALAQRLRDIYPPDQLTLLYIGIPGQDSRLREEYIVRNNLRGDHLLLTTDQYLTLNFTGSGGAVLLDRSGKVVKRNMPLPDQLEELKKQIGRQLSRN